MADEKKDKSSKVVEARSKFQSLLLNTIRFAVRLEDDIEFKLKSGLLLDLKIILNSNQVCC